MTEWHKVPEVPLLQPSEIHVWRIHLDQTPAQTRRLENCLSDDECQQAAGFHFSHDRRRFIIRRGILRNLLAAYLGSKAANIPLLRTPNDKPTISGQNGPTGIRFSCSHSDDWGLIALVRGRDLGVDLERHRLLVDLKDLAVACLSGCELIEWMNQPEALKTRCFFEAWTRKEAFVKAIGLGLSFPLKDVATSLASDQTMPAWKSVSLDIMPEYSAELVHENQDVSVRYFEWNFSLIQ